MKSDNYFLIHYTANKIRYEENNETLEDACENLLSNLTRCFQ